jgi:hypothetical protein
MSETHILIRLLRNWEFGPAFSKLGTPVRCDHRPLGNKSLVFHPTKQLVSIGDENVKCKTYELTKHSFLLLCGLPQVNNFGPSVADCGKTFLQR